MTFVLIGMAGCGKSCLGKSVAKILGINSIDVDKLIEEKYNKKLNILINDIGVEQFKKIEEETLLSIVDEGDTIVSTGGSAIYYPDAMNHLKSIGKIIYIYTSLSILKNRIGDFKARGMVMKDGQTIEQLYFERVALYEKYADVILDCDDDDYRAHKHSLLDYIRRKLKK